MPVGEADALPRRESRPDKYITMQISTLVKTMVLMPEELIRRAAVRRIPMLMVENPMVA
jgi:hypothetical protein